MRKSLLLVGSFGGLMCFFRYMSLSMEDEIERQRKLAVMALRR